MHSKCQCNFRIYVKSLYLKYLFFPSFKIQGRDVSFYVNSNFNFDNDIDGLMDSETFNKSLTVNPIKNIETMKKLHLYINNFCT